MTIEEVKQYRSQLEIRIMRLVDAFQQKTGYNVSEIELITQSIDFNMEVTTVDVITKPKL